MNLKTAYHREDTKARRKMFKGFKFPFFAFLRAFVSSWLATIFGIKQIAVKTEFVA